MNGIPKHCPKCNNKTKWKEQINPFTSGIPVGNDAMRINLFPIRGIFARTIKKKLGFYNVAYRCGNCGFTKIYERPR